MASWAADIHTEIARIHHQEILRRAREEQLLSLASGGKAGPLGRARDFFVAHRPRRAARRAPRGALYLTRSTT